ncbi:alpha-2-glucosyltransferase Alg10 [Endogone sp. FLAS-F59071]|nr:alpha-2-glucosyltransferase Alg10 [Endogone sp. FLAS-F59071]|eukprot:RUS21152.1 alpha-2-glucosyltransferase Alg10 [Endogone sp. FLAS-F59071]
MTAFALSLFPVGYFYNFLYYTDSGSTFFVLWAYLLAREGRYAYSGMVSAVSVTFRQTNIIWTCFILGISLVQILSSDPKVVQPKKTDSEDKRDQDPGLYNPLTGEIVSVGQIASSITSLITLTLKHMRYVLLRLYSFLLTLTGFIAFVIWNDGIVLGDRANHVAGLHFPQLFYFTAFTAFFAVPALLSGDVLRRVVVGPVTGGIGRLAALLGTGMAMFFLIDHFTVEHPFLLSDNRHYSFYVWKNIYRRHPLARYALIPGYIGAGWVLIQALAKTLPLLNLLIYITAVGLNLVPSPLLEFRYFIIPFIVYMVHAPVPNNTRLGVLFMMYVAVNFWTLYMFMRRGFEWESEPGRVQRFMW